TSDDVTYTPIDSMLLRDYGYYGRVDVLGLKAGSYRIRIVPVADGEELPLQAMETGLLEVRAHDRSGFAHMNNTSVGAYNADGTLKQDAHILYVTAQNAKTIQMEVTRSNKGATAMYTGLQHIVDAYRSGYETRPLCIRIIGTIEKDDLDSIGSKEEGFQIKGRKADSEMPITVEGVGNDATVKGFGFLTRNSKGVEFRNFALLRFMDDGLSFDTDNSNCWVHNIDFFYGQPGKDKDQIKGDGSLDCKADSKLMTFAYNHFVDAGKTSLCGMKSETGENFICYHHNWFDHSDSRHPRIRQMTVHVYNNYFDGVSKYGVGATTGSNVFVENNYFRGTAKPILTSMQGTDIKNGTANATFSSEAGGMIKSYGNLFAERPGGFSYITHKDNASSFDAYEAATRDEVVPGTYAALSGGSTYNNFDTDPAKMYTYSVTATADVPSTVTGAYGAGRMQGGDITWTFSTSDDQNYDLISGLNSLITSYTSSLVGILSSQARTALSEPAYDVILATPDSSRPVYDLYGRQVRILTKGQIYVQDGHKFLFLGQ
ncbi:MAG: hypothetical protein IJ680_09010, partial [Paludibacteraceae bacterium]|nr:hypothetical protein [Paludibacteraceae bacterium]